MAEVKLRMRRRMSVVLLVALLGFLAVIIKLADVQLVQGSDLKMEAEEARTRDRGVAAARGTIYDRNGDKLAVSITADSIAVRPEVAKESKEVEATAKFLAEKLDMEYADVYEKVNSEESYVWIKRKIDFGVGQIIKEAILEAEENNEGLLAGVEIEQETQRFYPQESLACHVLGYAGIDNQGLDGIELELDELLSGSDGRVIGLFDSAENPIQQEDYAYIPPENGHDVYLTIDRSIQYFCERELEALQSSESPAKQAGIIIMDPKTGDVLAMACSNKYDPNNYGDYTDSSRRNFLVSDSYEPGSTFKIITAATALEEGAADPLTSSYYDPGSVQVANARIHCWASVPHGVQTFAEAIKNSCNPAFVAIGQSIEEKEEGLFYKYIRAFGFGEPTGIDLPGEAEGILQDENNVNAVELATISIGQGIAVTPLQLITAVCAVANDGVLLKPQIISKVMDGEEVVQEREVVELRQVVSPSTAQQLREFLVGVVTEGSGGNAAISGYSIGGKTGTAQKASGGSYADRKYVSSFVGMVPAEDPQLVCLVVVDEPSGVFYGSQVAAPI
ncbi:MAG: penicillin-binding transpeptidase domain-containing protein, partial [Bacillota bacterium]|nr:penicillin-binding transpeptidase domain-containing protein [Bacillota bacterium]